MSSFLTVAVFIKIYNNIRDGSPVNWRLSYLEKAIVSQPADIWGVEQTETQADIEGPFRYWYRFSFSALCKLPVDQEGHVKVSIFFSVLKCAALSIDKPIIDRVIEKFLDV